ncbi:MAG: ATP-dependent sacrificial sulfur transferase LarE [Nitrospirota bacterium]
MKKLEHLSLILKDMESVVLAYSGGVDSTFLLKAAQLSEIRTIAVTAVSYLFARKNILEAQETAKRLGIEHRAIETDELSLDGFAENTPERCLLCKDSLFKTLKNIANAEGYRFVMDGSNRDDDSDYRPGRHAAARHGVRSPLAEAGFSKCEIRNCSRQLGLSTWDSPSSPCLVTRFPYGQKITREALRRVEQAEDFLRSLGFRQLRVRDHDGVARIEVGEEEMDLLLNADKRKRISENLKSLGYLFISLDLEGFRSGNLNRILFRKKE